MTGKIRKSIERILKLKAGSADCGVKGCENTSAEFVTLKAFDPIDHDNKRTFLCAEHLDWAERRNALAEDIYEELREKRREVGMDHIDDIQQVAVPQGALDKDVLDGSIKHYTDEVALSDVVDTL